MGRSFYVYCFVYIFVSWLPFPESETPHVFCKQRWILIILCWRSNRLIYWWPSKSIINEVHNCSNVTLYSYRGIFGRIYNHYSLNHSGKLLSIHLIKYKLQIVFFNLKPKVNDFSWSLARRKINHKCTFV